LISNILRWGELGPVPLAGADTSEDAATYQGGPTMFARIGIMRALNRHVERVFNPDRKDNHWGRRKLARDR
jgi:hypothetical protein